MGSFEGLDIRETREGCTFSAHVKPKSSRNKVMGVKEGKLLLGLKAPPVEGAANECAVEFLSGLFHKPKIMVELWKGHHSRDKIFRVREINAKEILNALEKEGLSRKFR